MSVIETSINKDADLTIQTVTGKISAKEISNAIENYFKGVLTKLVLWDFTNADLSSIKSIEIQDIVDVTKKYLNLRPVGKTAMVFSSDLGFGMGRMYGTKQEITKPDNISYMSFRDKGKALNWLQEK